MGEVPDWYSHIAVAKYLAVAPWELPPESPWKAAAVAAMNAEEHARSQKAKRRR